MLVNVSPPYFCHDTAEIQLDTAEIMYFQEYPPFIGLFFLVFEIFSDKCQFGAAMESSFSIQAPGQEQHFS